MTTTAALHPADIESVVELHRRAFPDFFLSQLGPNFLAQFYKGFLTDPTAVTVVAHDEAGKVLGAVVGTTQPAGFFSRLLKRRLLGFVGASAQAAAQDPKRIPRLARGVLYRGEAGERVEGALLSSICVDPATQGSGVGKLLIEAWCAEARMRGAQRAFLTTDAADNEATNGFYQRNGWTLTKEFSTPEGRAMNRYEKEL
ncbi:MULTISPECIES: GNAT family N-acetyltransferase [unclassified Luteococcus]|uniref:GNAT family N-acetyltransferase n=1 Tax=unclassified Luteococcus TaxID=2639923 RepID=UPI00313B8DF3